jgi:hypothetical protein
MNTTQEVKARPELELFHSTSYGKLALTRFGKVPEGFYIFCCGWLGKPNDKNDVMRVTGAVFRVAKRGPYKGMYSILVPGTEQSVYLTDAEVRAAKK